MDFAITINETFLWCIAGAITWICAFVWLWKQRKFFIPSSVCMGWCIALATSFEWDNSGPTLPNVAAIGVAIVALVLFIVALVDKYES